LQFVSQRDFPSHIFFGERLKSSHVSPNSARRSTSAEFHFRIMNSLGSNGADPRLIVSVSVGRKARSCFQISDPIVQPRDNSSRSFAPAVSSSNPRASRRRWHPFHPCQRVRNSWSSQPILRLQSRKPRSFRQRQQTTPAEAPQLTHRHNPCPHGIEMNAVGHSRPDASVLYPNRPKSSLKQVHLLISHPVKSTGKRHLQSLHPGR